MNPGIILYYEKHINIVQKKERNDVVRCCTKGEKESLVALAVENEREHVLVLLQRFAKIQRGDQRRHELQLWSPGYSRQGQGESGIVALSCVCVTQLEFMWAGERDLQAKEREFTAARVLISEAMI